MIDLKAEISKADAAIIGDLVLAVLERYRALFPDWDIFTFSIDRTLSRNEQIDQTIRLLESMKTFPK